MSLHKNNNPNSSTRKQPQMITLYDFAIILDSHVLIISGHNCIERVGALQNSEMTN